MAADMPTANRITVGIMAMVAEDERRMISARTKAALQAPKDHGTVLGGFRGVKADDQARALSIASRKAAARARAADVAPVIPELRTAGTSSLGALAKAPTDRGNPTANGAATWSPMHV